MKVLTGKVIHTKMAKTATVEVERIVAHPVYKKRIKRVKKYQVHDLLGAVAGQTVRFIPSRAYSKTKKFRLIEIVGVKPAKKEVKEVKTPAKKEVKEKTVKKAVEKPKRKAAAKK